MSLTSGTRLGVYEIVAPLGAGGMGEVYRARDMKLGRDVALKILPDVFAGDPERLARFEREARTLAALNHPHIAHLHGVEESGPTRALVMELVEGEDLAERIRRGAIPLDEALALAKQIAQALEAAHEQGIIHRDLKPANIKVREDGTVKVLDFGLAKALEGAGGAGGAGRASGVGGQEPMNSPTITTPAMTMHGMILGTAAYMAPEQAKGKPVDKRADIWAFGCVLYEMVTGRRAFAGEDVSDTLASVLRAEVDWTRVPPSLVRLLKTCLERDPRHRLHDIGDAWALIDERTASRAGGARRAWLPWAIAALLLVVAAALAFIHFTEVAALPAITRFQIHAPPGNNFDIYLTMSPDGRRLAFTARDEKGVLRLWVRDLDAMDARPLPGTENAWGPFWSPDGRHLAFSVDRQLKRIDVSGGPPQTICDSPNIVGTGSWHHSGVILFGTRGTGGDAIVRRVSASGGDPVAVTALDATRGETFHAFPSFLNDGRHFLYLRQSSKTELQGLYVGTVDATPDQQPLRRVVNVSFGPAHVVRTPDGQARLLFVRDANLVAQPFDLDRLEVVGDAIPLAERLGSSGSFAFVASSAVDTFAYRSGSATATNLSQLTWVNRQGDTIGRVGEPRSFSINPRSLSLSPDGRGALAVLTPTAGQGDLWQVDLARDTSTRFTFEDRGELDPVWSPDGRRVAYRNSRPDASVLLVKDANGSTSPVPVLTSPDIVSPSDWSPDGRWLLVVKSGVQLQPDLWILPVDGDKNLIRLTETPFAEPTARFSPDGRWVAYQSNETGRPEIYIRPFQISSDGKPMLGAPWLVSTDGGVGMRWRRDGREIFYRHPAGAVMAADVSMKADVLTTTRPRQLFAVPAGVIHWDGAPDGQRFLVGVPVVPAVADPISVVLNWSQALQR